ncbi:unnamed protein product [Rangifer tarandus platyrhynchus]|uniref:Uncharacterized protein n=1 Tax=Rangifer tarandus platyrhynchus TaxID=3082113 RepID=A0ACB1MJN0_RANTA
MHYLRHTHLLFALCLPIHPSYNSFHGLFPPDTVFVVVQALSRVRLLVTPWTAAHQASLSFTISRTLCKLTFVESVMPFNHLIPCCPLLFFAFSLSQHQGLFQ